METHNKGCDFTTFHGHALITLCAEFEFCVKDFIDLEGDCIESISISQRVAVPVEAAKDGELSVADRRYDRIVSVREIVDNKLAVDDLPLSALIIIDDGCRVNSLDTIIAANLSVTTDSVEHITEAE